MEKEFRASMQDRGMTEEDIAVAIAAVRKMEAFMQARGLSLDQSGVSDLKDYMSVVVHDGENSPATLSALSRYSALAGKSEFAIYLMPLVGVPDIYRRLSARVAAKAGSEVHENVFDDVLIPARGSPPEHYPFVTGAIVTRLERLLDPPTCRSVLAGNMHGIPAEAFADAKQRFLSSSGLDEFLDDEHRRKLENLESHMKQGRLFYEQKITPRVLEWVRSNKEVMSGERSGDRVYVTKIPFAPDDYLQTTDPGMKRYYACHCPLAREALLSHSTTISPTWCYCSAGFAKLKYDVIFEQETEALLLETPFKGDLRCRFSIAIPTGVRF